MKNQVILAAAGQGLRLKTKVPKPLVLLDNKPLFIYALEKFEACRLIESVIVVAHPKNVKEFESQVKKYRLKKISRIIPGGARRSDSVYNGLQVLDKATQYVLIHDAARPFVSLKLIEKAIRLCYQHQALIVAVPVKPTIKRVDPRQGLVEATLDRRFLWEVQTPQVFRLDIIMKAHREFRHLEVTDDASLVERSGQPVKVLQGDYANIKITTAEDMVLAQQILKFHKKSKSKRGPHGT